MSFTRVWEKDSFNFGREQPEEQTCDNVCACLKISFRGLYSGFQEKILQ
jgi:hypothetical protein